MSNYGYTIYSASFSIECDEPDCTWRYEHDDPTTTVPMDTVIAACAIHYMDQHHSEEESGTTP